MRISRIDAVFGNRNFLPALNALLGIVLILSALLVLRGVLTAFTPAKKQLRDEVKKTGQTPRPALQDYAGIVKNNPFGAPPGELRALTAESSESGAAQDSNVILIGTISGTKEMSYAIFAEKSGKQDVFRSGQKVFGAGTLKKVEPNRVVLLSNHREVTIPLADVVKVTEIKAPPGAPAGTFGKKTGESSYLIDQQRIQQALEKPDQIMTDARFVPNFVEGKQQGFVLREVKPGGIYQSLGLQNGDVLLRINEFTISNPETALQAVTALRGIDRAQLDIMRNGNKMTMTYQIR